MALWEEVVYVGHLHNLYSTGQINVVQLAKGMVGRLQSVKYYGEADPDFLDVIMEFDALNELSCHEDYRIAFDYLLAYGDEGNRLWVETEKPTPKDEVEENNRVVNNVSVKMLDDYDNVPQVNIDLSKPISSIHAPYKPHVSYYRSTTSKATPSTTDNTSFTSSATSSKKYNRRKTVRFLSDYEMDRRIKAKGLSPNVLHRDFYNYVRDADDDYQDWILDRFVENMAGEVKAKQEVIEIGQ